MRKDLFILLLVLYSVLISSSAIAASPRIIGPDMEIKDNNIIVNIGITNVKELEKTIKSGIEKDIVFTVELLRSWRFWPDEFIVSKTIQKIIKYDNLREQYRVSTYDGTSRVEKNFRDFNKMKLWIFTTNAINLANIRELEPGDYYIRVIVESKSREHSSVIGFLMHLIPEVEMSIAKESQSFIIGQNKNLINHREH